MIESLSITNFLSFKEKSTIDFKTNPNKSYKDFQVVKIAKDVKLLKLGIIFGANASGKSNFIKAFQFLKSFWRSSQESKDDEIDIIPFVLTKDKPSEFTLIFYVKNVKHIYQLILTSNIVLEENLIAYYSQRPAVIFKRSFSNNTSKINFGFSIEINTTTQEAISLNCLSNISVFSAYNKVNTHIDEIDNVLNWINKHFLDNIDPDMRLQEYVNELIIQNPKIKNKILLNLKEADFNISNIFIKKREEFVPDHIIKAFQLLEIDSEISGINNSNKLEISESFFEHIATIKGNNKLTFSLPNESQSRGTMRMFGLSGALLTTIEQNAFLAVDEIEFRLHPLLIKYVLKKFLYDSDKAQLLVTSHYDNLLDCKELITKENIWFTAKGDDASSTLIPFSSFPGVNRITSWQKAYKTGDFKAIPNIDFIK